MTSRELENFIDNFRATRTRLSVANANVKYYDDKTQDLLHRLELEDITYHECARISKEIALTRKERRKAKDDVELLTPTVDFCENNKKFVDGLAKLLGDLRKIEQRREIRTYKPKVSD